jgi:hypothetical protein
VIKPFEKLELGYAVSHTAVSDLWNCIVGLELLVLSVLTGSAGKLAAAWEAVRQWR